MKHTSKFIIRKNVTIHLYEIVNSYKSLFFYYVRNCKHSNDKSYYTVMLCANVSSSLALTSNKNNKSAVIANITKKKHSGSTKKKRRKQ